MSTSRICRGYAVTIWGGGQGGRLLPPPAPLPPPPTPCLPPPFSERRAQNFPLSPPLFFSPPPSPYSPSSHPLFSLLPPPHLPLPPPHLPPPSYPVRPLLYNRHFCFVFNWGSWRQALKTSLWIIMKRHGKTCPGRRGWFLHTPSSFAVV